MNEKKKNNKFWIVYSKFEDVEIDNHKFYSLVEAEKEAKKLATENPTCDFFVLESVGVASISEAVYTKF